MTTSVAWLLVLVGALIIAAGCQRPLDAAIVSANVAAASLTAAHGAITEARRADQLAAARRVVGDRDDPAVRAEMLDRAAQGGVEYREAWDAYTAARRVWLAVVEAIQVAQAAGDDVDLADVERLLVALAREMRALETARAEVRHVR